LQQEAAWEDFMFSLLTHVILHKNIIYSLVKKGLYRRFWEAFIVGSRTDVDQSDVEHDVC